MSHELISAAKAERSPNGLISLVVEAHDLSNCLSEQHGLLPHVANSVSQAFCLNVLYVLAFVAIPENDLPLKGLVEFHQQVQQSALAVS